METAKPGWDENNDTLQCPYCEEKSLIPPIITGSVCFGCRFRDGQVAHLKEENQQLRILLKEVVGCKNRHVDMELIDIIMKHI